MLASGEPLLRNTFNTADRLPFSFAEALIKAIAGDKGVVEPSFVYLPGVPGGTAIKETTKLDYFSVPIELGVGSTILLLVC